MTNSSSLNKEKILDALSGVMLPEANRDVVDAGLISGVTIHGARVGFLLEGDASREALRRQCEGAVQTLPEVEQVTAVLTAHNDSPGEPRKQAVWNHQPIEGIKQIIAIASGKGGVGKSSIATLLALADAKQGKSVGLLDADIYGPSIPTMLGVSEQAEVKDNKLIPQTAHNIQAMSMGMLIGDQAAVMRAPRVTKAIQQMLRQTDWTNNSSPHRGEARRGASNAEFCEGRPLPNPPPEGEGILDVLYIDLPPGTGDVHLSMVQQAPINGAIIVTLASKVAALDARKSIEMFEKVNVPILGIIENMTSIAGGPTPFGSGGGEQLAKQTGYPLLAKLPLEPDIGELLNEGKNPFEENNESALLKTISTISYAK